MRCFKKFSPLLLTFLIVTSGCSKPKEPPQSFFSEMDHLSETGNYTQLVKAAQTMAKKHPDSGRLQRIIGNAEFSQTHFSEAADALQSAVDRGYGGAETRRMLGLSYFYTGDFDEAAAQLEAVLRQQSLDTEAMRHLGYLYYYLGQGAKAVAVFEKLRDENPQDLESLIALDGLLALTKKWQAAQMIWYSEPSSGLQFCYPGGWLREDKEKLISSGKTISRLFYQPLVSSGGRFSGISMMLVSVDNARHVPSENLLKGPWRMSGQTAEGENIYSNLSGNADSPKTQAVSREPEEITRWLSRQGTRMISSSYNLAFKERKISSWVGVRGQARYCLGEELGEDESGRLIYGNSAGIYDPGADHFFLLMVYGPSDRKEDTAALFRAVFQTALFGGVAGIPPAPGEWLPEKEYIARTQGFLQNDASARALTEAKEGIKAYPNSGEMFFWAGKSHAALWDMEEAAKAYEQAKEKGFSSAELEFALGQSRLMLGQYAEAEKAFLRGLQIDSANVEVLMGLAKTSFWQNQMDRSIELFEKIPKDSARFEEAAYYAGAVRALQGIPGPVQWYSSQNGSSFCYPANWEAHESTEPDGKNQIIFYDRSWYQAGSLPESILLYEWQDSASHRTQKIRVKSPPEQILNEFFTDYWEKLPDPLKTIKSVSPILRKGSDRFLWAEGSYTENSIRKTVRWLACYNPEKDRLHLLEFHSAGTSLGKWSLFADVCLNTAHFE